MERSTLNDELWLQKPLYAVLWIIQWWPTTETIVASSVVFSYLAYLVIQVSAYFQTGLG